MTSNAFPVDIFSLSSADLIGEVLRDITFTGEGRGCYSHFNLRPGVTAVEESEDVRAWLSSALRKFCGNEEYIEEFLNGSTLYQLALDVFAVWYWDGDGTLVYLFKDKFLLVNTDCKKSYGWEIYPLDPACKVKPYPAKNPVAAGEDALADPLYGPAHAVYSACCIVLEMKTFDRLIDDCRDIIKALPMKAVLKHDGAIQSDGLVLRKTLTHLSQEYPRAREINTIRRALKLLDRFPVDAA